MVLCDVTCWAIALLACVVVACLIACIFADCDLLLSYAERFGRPKSVLQGKVVWITGASSGIGEALAYELAAVRAKLVLSARREAELERVKKQCLLHGSSVNDIMCVPMDLRDFSSFSACTDKVLHEFGQIDVLVNNGGRSQRAAWDKVDIEVDKELFAVNVFGTVALTRVVLPSMLKRNSGQIVVTSSVAGKLGAPYSGTYSGSKFALHGYFEALRWEKLLDKNIGITLVCPGPVVSEVRKNSFTATPDKAYGLEMSESEPMMMATQRCAHLMMIAMANRLNEVWISKQPILAATYALQYFPTVTQWIMKNIVGATMMKRLRRIRDSSLPDEIQ